MEELGGILNQAERYMQTEKGKCICTGIHVNTGIRPRPRDFVY